MAGRANELLGYPRDARLLILNADDLGMHPGMNAGVAAAVERGPVRSASVIVPSPWSAEAMRWAAGRPELSLGVHLTLVNDLPGAGWRPLSPPEQVPSLVDGRGCFRSLAELEAMLARASIAEVELEFRAQLEAVLAVGLHPTHLDWHCLYDGNRPEVFRATLSLARAHGLAIRTTTEPWIGLLQAAGLATDDHPLLDSYEVPVAEKPEVYHRMLRALPAGLTQWAMHPGVADAGARAMDPDGADIRQSDLDFLVDPETGRILREEGIVLVEYRHLQRAWLARDAADAPAGLA